MKICELSDNHNILETIDSRTNYESNNIYLTEMLYISNITVVLYY